VTLTIENRRSGKVQRIASVWTADPHRLGKWAAWTVAQHAGNTPGIIRWSQPDWGVFP
jgi:hypothetical protein